MESKMTEIKELCQGCQNLSQDGCAFDNPYFNGRMEDCEEYYPEDYYPDEGIKGEEEIEELN